MDCGPWGRQRTTETEEEGQELQGWGGEQSSRCLKLGVGDALF